MSMPGALLRSLASSGGSNTAERHLQQPIVNRRVDLAGSNGSAVADDASRARQNVGDRAGQFRRAHRRHDTPWAFAGTVDR